MNASQSNSQGAGALSLARARGVDFNGRLLAIVIVAGLLAALATGLSAWTLGPSATSPAAATSVTATTVTVHPTTRRLTKSAIDVGAAVPAPSHSFNRRPTKSAVSSGADVPVPTYHVTRRPTKFSISFGAPASSPLPATPDRSHGR